MIKEEEKQKTAQLLQQQKKEEKHVKSLNDSRRNLEKVNGN